MTGVSEVVLNVKYSHEVYLSHGISCSIMYGLVTNETANLNLNIQLALKLPRRYLISILSPLVIIYKHMKFRNGALLNKMYFGYVNRP